MGKKYKKKVQWKQLSLNDLLTPDSEKQTGDDCEEEEGDSAPHTPTHENAPYPRHPYKPNFTNGRRGTPRQNGFYHATYDRRFDPNFERYNNENFRNLENRGGAPFDKPYNKPFYERNYHYDKFYGRPPFYGERNFKFGPGGFVDRGHRPFRPYGRPGGFFPPRGFQGHFQGPFRDGHGNKGINGCEGEEEDEEWDDEGILLTDGQQQYQQQMMGGEGERPSQPVHTVMINNEEYTKIQTPRQEVIFKKSSLDRKRDSIDLCSVTGSLSSGSGSSITTAGEHGSGSGASGDQAAGDGSSVAGSVEDTSLSGTGDDPPDSQQQDQVFEDPNEIFAGEPGGPPLAGVVMQQAYPGGPMITIPVHWTPFIDPGLIPGETALTPLDPAFTHVIDPKAMPIDPLHILPVQHDASGCPVHVQVKVDSNGVPIQIQPSAFTVSLSSLHQQQQGVLNQQHQQQQQQQQLLQQQQQTEDGRLDESVAKQSGEERLAQGESPKAQCQLEQRLLEERALHLKQCRRLAEHSHLEEQSHLEEHSHLEDHSHLEERSHLEGQSHLEHHPHEEDDTNVQRDCSIEHRDDNGILREEWDQQSEEQSEEQEDDGEHHETVMEDEEEQQEQQLESQNQTEEIVETISREMSEERMGEMEVSEGLVDDSEENEEEKEEETEEGEGEEEGKDVMETDKIEVDSEVERKDEIMVGMEEEEEEEEYDNEEEEDEEVVEDEKVKELPSKETEEVRAEEREKEKSDEIDVDDTSIDTTLSTTPTASSSTLAAAATKTTTSSTSASTTASASASASSTTPTTSTTVTTPAVPSTNPPEVTSSPAVEARRKRSLEEEEEEEEEEDMLNKESEEASDSSDSQYASMSETSSTPTTPAGEPSDAHESTESQAEACKNTTETDPSLNAPDSSSHTDESTPCHTEVEPVCTTASSDIETSETSGINETDQTHTEDSNETSQETHEETDEFANTQSHSEESTEKVLQGYVMVPILTPYYDPSVLYGYPVVVADQQQQHQNQRGYSKRKKKKYQRRRHADGSPSGGYLDPQLYTGEPFVATPGGYVVPVDAATSVCQVHGFQYMTPSFHPHPQHLDEGFVQHSPYLTSVVLDPAAAQQAQLFIGTNQDDGSRRIFSDLQEKERRQIQEILHEQRAKVGKSDSTESSDSGVSESEEAVATELSSDEHGSHKNDQESLQSCGKPEEILAVDEPTSSHCEGECLETFEANEDIKSSAAIQERIDSEENSSLNVSIQEVADEVNAQYEVSSDNSIQDNSCTTTDDQNQLLSDCDASIQQDSDLIQRCTDSPLTNDPDTVKSDETLKDKHNRHSSCNATYSDQEHPNQERSVRDSSEESFPSCNSLIESTENLNDLGNKSEFDFTQNPQDITDEKQSDNVQSVVQLDEQRPSSDIDDVSQQHLTSISQGASCGAEELPLKQDIAQENSAVADEIINPVFCQRLSNLSSEGDTPDSSIDRGILKDLKVTEAVKRWIREVTPEKAFLLSEVQARLLENDIQGEMDTEDEYIEDEIPQNTQSTVRDSKNAGGNPFAAASSDATIAGMESCNKRVAVSNRQRGTTPDTFDDYDGSSTISNLSYDHLYSEASSSQPASFSHSFDEEEVGKYSENPNICNPVVYAKYYQLGVEVDDTTPSATPLPQTWPMSRETTPAVQTESETVSECGSEDIETVPHKYDVVCQYTATSPMSLATEILKAEKVLSNMTHITGSQQKTEASGNHFGNPDRYLKHYGTTTRIEVGDSGVQSEESSDEMEGRSNVGSSGVGSSLASTPAISPAHRISGRPPLQPHPLKNLSAGDGPVPCRTVCCAVM